MTSEEECIDALLEAAEQLGESPSKAKYEGSGLRPASATIIRTLGGWNKAKKAAGLRTNPSTGSRTVPKPDYVKLPEDASWADLSVDQRWHYRHADWNTERTMKRRARLRSWVNNCKGTQGCERCGIDDPACLDFHHVNGDDKEMAIGKMVTYGYGKKQLRAEMANCQVLWANCHRRHHEGSSSAGANSGHTSARGQKKTWIDQYKQSCGGCRRCSETDPVCLEFHHVTGDKAATVARLISDGCPKEKIREEISKCIVLCANCHRRGHHVPPNPSGSSQN